MDYSTQQAMQGKADKRDVSELASRIESLRIENVELRRKLEAANNEIHRTNDRLSNTNNIIGQMLDLLIEGDPKSLENDFLYLKHRL